MGRNYPTRIHGFNPNRYANAFMWNMADAGITKNGSNQISNWANQLGLGSSYDLAQATTAKQPIWTPNVRNGLPSVRCDGLAQYLQGNTGLLGATNGSTGITLIVVCTNTLDSGIAQSGVVISTETDGTSYRYAIVKGSANALQGGVKAVYGDSGAFPTQGSSSYALLGNTPQILSLIVDFASPVAEFYNRGVLKGTISTGMNPVSGHASALNSFGVYVGSRNNANFWQGDFHEIIAWNNNPLRSANASLHRAAVAYLADKWGV